MSQAKACGTRVKTSRRTGSGGIEIARGDEDTPRTEIDVPHAPAQGGLDPAVHRVPSGLDRDFSGGRREAGQADAGLVFTYEARTASLEAADIVLLGGEVEQV